MAALTSKWLCPNDRELTMRSKLPGGAHGWSTKATMQASSQMLTEDEMAHIKRTLQIAEHYQEVECLRVRHMLSKLERLQRGSSVHTSKYHCRLCGSDFTFITKHNLKNCTSCDRSVCSSCGFQAPAGGGQKWICHYCSECQQVWKKSGVWFYGKLPKHYSDPINQNDAVATLSHGHAQEHRAFGGKDTDSIDSCQMQQFTQQKQDDDEMAEPADDSSEGDFDESSGEDLDDAVSRHLKLARSAAKARATARTESGRPEPKGKGNVLAFYKSTPPGSPVVRGRSPAFSTLAKPSTLKRGCSPSMAAESQDSDCSRKGLSKTPKSSPEEKRSQLVFKRQGTHPRPSQADDSGSEGDSVEEMDVDKLVQEVTVKRSMRHKNEVIRSTSSTALGSIYFTVAFDAADCRLTVVIDKCIGLIAMDHNGMSDPFVVVQLLPWTTKATEKRTAVVKKNCNPVFKESFTYHGITEKELPTYTLRLQVYDHDRVTQDDFIGEVLLPLTGFHVNVCVALQKELRPHQEVSCEMLAKDPLGKVQVSLHYITSQKCLVIGILRAAGLKPMDQNGLSDPYVKCYLHPDQRKVTKQKTRVVRRTLDPVFNTEFRYSVERETLTHKTLEVSVWDYDRASRNDFIGTIYLSKTRSGLELKHYYDMLTMVDRTHTVWHTLHENKMSPSDF